MKPRPYGKFAGWIQSGEVHEGIHEPIISKKLSDEVQAILHGRLRWSPTKVARTPKAFLGLLHCANCGGAITAELQKGHNVAPENSDSPR